MFESAARDWTKLHRVSAVPCSDILFALAIRSDNGALLVGSSDASVYQLDMSTEKPERIKFSGDGHRSYVTGLAQVGSHVISGGYDGQLIWWDLQSQSSVRAIAAHDKWIRCVIAVPGDKWIVSVADDMRCRVWDAVTGQRVADFTDHAPTTPHHFPSMLYAVAASPDGRFIATGDRVGHVAIWETATWTKTAEVEAPVMYTWDPVARRHSIGGIRSLAFSNDGSKLAAGGIGKINNIDHLEGRARIEVFDWQSGKRLHELEDEKRKGLVEHLAWLPESNVLLAAGGDHKGFLMLYDGVSGELIHHDGCDGHVHALAWTEASNNLMIAGHERIESWSL